MKLNCKDFGSGGTPVVFLHGLLGSLDNFQGIAKELAQERRVLTVDHRNHGKSPHSSVFNYDVMVADLKVLFDDLGIEKAVLLGHSLGGKVAMHFALKNSSICEKLVVVDMGPGQYPPGGHQDVFDALTSVDLGSVRSRDEVDAQMQTYIGDFGLRQFLMKGLKREPQGGFSWKFNLSAILANYDRILEPVTAFNAYLKPCLFIKGGNSPYIDGRQEAAVKPLFPLAQIVTIPNAAHWVHADKPDEFLAALRQFL